jgi:hypothetical protein
MDTILGDYVGSDGWICGGTHFVYVGWRESFRVSFDSPKPLDNLSRIKARLDALLYSVHGRADGITSFTEEVRTNYYAPKLPATGKPKPRVKRV